MPRDNLGAPFGSILFKLRPQPLFVQDKDDKSPESGGSRARRGLCAQGKREAHLRSLASSRPFPGRPGMLERLGRRSLPPAAPGSPQTCGPAHLRGPHLSGAHSVALPGAKAPEPRGRVRRPPPEPGHCTDRGEGAKHSHRAVAYAHVRTALVPAVAAPAAHPVRGRWPPGPLGSCSPSCVSGTTAPRGAEQR